MALKQLLIPMIFVAVFALALIIGGEGLISNNSNKSLLALDSDLYNYTVTINSTFETYGRDVKKIDSAFTNSSTDLTGGIPYITAIGGAWKVAKNTPKILYDTTVGLVMSKLFTDSQSRIILTVIGAILTLSIIFAVYKLIATGESER